jgi:cytochrome c5
MEGSMRRRWLKLMTTLAAATMCAALGACDPGVYQEGQADAGGTSTPPPTTTPPPSDQPDAGGASAQCEPLSTQQLDGRHNVGQPCQGCHGTGVGGAPKFTMGGTVYQTQQGVGAIQGATIIVTGADGKVQKAISANNGNFWTVDPIAYPATVSASLCPDTKPMVTQITDGDCNSGNCHGPQAAVGRVHVP